MDIAHVTPERFSRAWLLRLRYRDQPRISFTDLTSFVVMRELDLRRRLRASKRSYGTPQMASTRSRGFTGRSVSGKSTEGLTAR